MKYKGFIISPVYSICADWDINKNGLIYSKRPKVKDIEYYEILDPMENGRRYCAENSIAECKAEIDRLLVILNMKDNTPASWVKLEGEHHAR